MEQQTAVEWLFDQMPLEWTIKGSAKKIFEQAKQMEKEQIQIAYGRGRIDAHSDSFDEDWGREFDPMTPEQYYNETYSK